MSKEPKKEPAEQGSMVTDSYGVGMLADGTLNVVTPDEYVRRVAERNAEEALFEQDADAATKGEK